MVDDRARDLFTEPFRTPKYHVTKFSALSDHVMTRFSLNEQKLTVFDKIWQFSSVFKFISIDIREYLMKDGVNSVNIKLRSKISCHLSFIFEPIHVIEIFTEYPCWTDEDIETGLDRSLSIGASRCLLVRFFEPYYEVRTFVIVYKKVAPEIHFIESN